MNKQKWSMATAAGICCILLGCGQPAAVGPKLDVDPIATSENEGIHYHFYVGAAPEDVEAAWESGVDAMNLQESEQSLLAVIIVPTEKVPFEHPQFRTTFQDRDGRQLTHVWTAEPKADRKAYIAVSGIPSGFVKASTIITDAKP